MATQQIDIATIEDFLNALRNPDLKTRAAMLQAIALYPEKASSLAEKGNVDLFDELVTLREKPTEAAIRIGYLEALFSLDDERKFNVAKDEFLATDNMDIALLVASKLAMLPQEELINFFGPVVIASNSQTKCRAAANLLAHCKNLPAKLAVKVVVASDHVTAIAPLGDENLQEWLKALQGPTPRKARRVLLAKGDGSFESLLTHWGKLPDTIKLWAFKEAIKHDPGKHESLILDVLQQESNIELLLAALESVAFLARKEADEKIITDLFRHTDPRVRAAAIRACQSNLDWGSLLQDEPEDQIRVVIIEQIGRNRQIENMNLLACLIEDPNWRIRAAITNSMVALAPESIPLLQRLFLHRMPAVRAAAAQALQKSGQGSWLEAQLPSH